MDPNSNPSQADKILARLMATPNAWVEMPELARVSGAFAVHSRISELRTVRKLSIEHRQERIFASTQRASFYRLVLLEDGSTAKIASSETSNPVAA